MLLGQNRISLVLADTLVERDVEQEASTYSYV